MSKKATAPITIAVGFENRDAIQEMRTEISAVGQSINLGRPVLLQDARHNPAREGFNDFAEMMISAVCHATDIRIDKQTVFGIGMAPGLVYVPRLTKKQEAPLLFETILIVLVDEHGVIGWSMPEETMPSKAGFMYQTIGKTFKLLQEKRKVPVPSGLTPLFQGALAMLIGRMRPFPSSYGALQKLQ